MAMGQCDFMACRSMLGTAFRATFRLGSHEDAARGDREVLLCPEHERQCREIRDQNWTSLVITIEGTVYPLFWMDSLAYR